MGRVRVQNGDTISDVALGRLEPDGQFVFILKPSEQNATRGNIAELETRLAAIEDLLSTSGLPTTRRPCRTLTPKILRPVHTGLPDGAVPPPRGTEASSAGPDVIKVASLTGFAAQ